ncbi:hypothetical protein HDU91_002730 [Kappamyces sp. JEL0680]|nr:hypothetical protein HDU91_002730 [Kappamyces sp. JEL0680]
MMNISVTNTNYYPLKVDRIELVASILANGTMINNAIPLPASALFGREGTHPRIWVTKDNYKSPIGRGFYGSILFPSRVPTELLMPFTVTYATNPGVGAVDDPLINEIIQLCLSNPVLSPTNNRTTTIAYSATSTVPFLSLFGYRPTLSSQLNINCPLQGLSVPADARLHQRPNSRGSHWQYSEPSGHQHQNHGRETMIGHADS